jgi:hypothetical protein
MGQWRNLHHGFQIIYTLRTKNFPALSVLLIMSLNSYSQKLSAKSVAFKAYSDYIFIALQTNAMTKWGEDY